MSRTAERAAFALLLVAVLASGYRTALKATHDGSAITRWRNQLQDLSAGVDISERHNYPNPPVMAVLLEPLAYLSPLHGALVWFALKVLMAAAAFLWMCRLVGDLSPWARLLAALLCLKPVLDDLTHGNVNLFILFLVVACFAARQARRDGLAGLLLALAVACKVTPALLVPYFVYKRAWRLLLGGAIGMMLFFYPGYVPAARLGMNHNLEQLGSWCRVMVQPFVAEGKVTAEHINQSLPGLTTRLLTRSPSFVTFENDVETPARYDNVLSLSPRVAGWLVKGCLLAFGLAVVWSCRSPGRGGWRLGAEYGLIVVGMLLFSERTWKHHAVTLMVPFVVLAARLPADPRLWGVAAASMALMLLPGLGGGGERETVWASPPPAKMALVYGAYTWLFLLLAGTMAALARGGASPAAAAVPRAEEQGPAQAA